jgi:phosphatidylserine synthase
MQVEEGSRRRFVGLSILPSGLIIATVATLHPPGGLTLALTVAVSLLMVSRVPFPTLAELRLLGPPTRRSDGIPVGATRE